MIVTKDIVESRLAWVTEWKACNARMGSLIEWYSKALAEKVDSGQ